VTAQQDDTDRFYALLHDLSDRVGGPRRLNDTSPQRWPAQGVIFFCEEGEDRHWDSHGSQGSQGSQGSHRVVRVDTHALTQKSTTTLWQRLCAHRGCVSGSRPGGGDHRTSNFRMRVGTALLSRGEWPAAVRQGWSDKRAGFAARDGEYLLEVAVTEHIGGMRFLWLAARDRNDRALIAGNTIALLSRRSGGLDQPSAQWLGLEAESEKVRTSALWNEDHVDETYDPAFLDTLERLVRTA
jgi:hypothetical protein